MGPKEEKKETKNPFVALFRINSAFWEGQDINILGLFVCSVGRCFVWLLVGLDYKYTLLDVC